MNDPQGKERFPKLYTQSINGKEKIWIILITLKSELPFIQGHQKVERKLSQKDSHGKRACAHSHTHSCVKASSSPGLNGAPLKFIGRRSNPPAPWTATVFGDGLFKKGD